MTEIREGLNRRLDELRARLDQDKRALLMNGPHADQYLHAQRNISELREVEAILATMQLADAQLALADAQREVAEAQRDETDARSKKASAAEEFSFWSRRFLTTVTVAHAVGLVSTLAFLTKADSPKVSGQSAESIVILFFAGLMLGGSYPILMMLRYHLFGSQPQDSKISTLIAAFVWPGATTYLFLAALLKVIGLALGIQAGR